MCVICVWTGLVNSFGVDGLIGVRDSVVLSLTKVGGVFVRSSASD